MYWLWDLCTLRCCGKIFCKHSYSYWLLLNNESVHTMKTQHNLKLSILVSLKFWRGDRPDKVTSEKAQHGSTFPSLLHIWNSTHRFQSQYKAGLHLGGGQGGTHPLLEAGCLPPVNSHHSYTQYRKFDIYLPYKKLSKSDVFANFNTWIIVSFTLRAHPPLHLPLGIKSLCKSIFFKWIHVAYVHVHMYYTLHTLYKYIT